MFAGHRPQPIPELSSATRLERSQPFSSGSCFLEGLPLWLVCAATGKMDACSPRGRHSHFVAKSALSKI